jgi:hypothetical protein
MADGTSGDVFVGPLPSCAASVDRPNARARIEINLRYVVVGVIGVIDVI